MTVHQWLLVVSLVFLLAKHFKEKRHVCSQCPASSVESDCGLKATSKPSPVQKWEVYGVINVGNLTFDGREHRLIRDPDYFGNELPEYLGATDIGLIYHLN